MDWSSIERSRGEGVRVLVLDSGVETTHEAFAGTTIGSYRAEMDGPLRRIVEDAEGDVYGHGTAVASIIHRYAPGALIDSVKVMGRAEGWSSLVVAGMHWGIERGYDIINCSFTTQNAEHLGEYKSVVDRAFCRSVQIVSACNNKEYWREEYPGSFPTVLSTDHGKMEALRISRRAGRLVEFVACGQGVRVAWKGGGYRVMSGSSFAAGHLSALVARLLQGRRGMNAVEVKGELYGLAT